MEGVVLEKPAEGGATCGVVPGQLHHPGTTGAQITAELENTQVQGVQLGTGVCVRSG